MCDGSDELTEIKITEPQIIYEINCQCSLIANDYILPSLTTECKNNQTQDATKFIALYATNLPVLRKYFTALQLIGVQVHTLLQDKLDVSVPDLKIVQDKLNLSMNLNLAVQNRAEFSLNKIVNASLTRCTLILKSSTLVIRAKRKYIRSRAAEREGRKSI